jgi:cholesterol oxidase
LLLRCGDQHRTLPRLSRRLGHNWSANANVLSMATYDDAERVQQSVGPTISSITDFIDGGANGERFVIEDDGFPNLLMQSLRLCIADGGMAESGQSMLRQIEEHSRGGKGLRNVMVWLGAGVDAADGELRLKRPWIAPWTTVLDLRWAPDQSKRVVEAILAMHRRMTDATGGHLSPNAGWTTFESLLTLHPLGGCNIGATAEAGVVDHLGQVFGYPNLFVVDGAIVPTPIGAIRRTRSPRWPSGSRRT